MSELFKNMRELKQILYGNSDSEPVAEACAQLTQEFFKEDTLRLFIKCLPKLNLEVLMKFMRPPDCAVDVGTLCRMGMLITNVDGGRITCLSNIVL